MGVKKRVLFIIAGTFTVLVVLFLLVLFFLVKTRFLHVERETAAKSMVQVRKALEEEQAVFGISASDYAFWDDTWQFMHDRSPRYLTLNFSDEVLDKFRINYLAMYANDGALLYGFHRDQGAKTREPLPPYFALLAPSSPLLRSGDFSRNGFSGIVALPEGMVLVAAYPVLKSDFGGPRRGTLLWGRMIGADVMEHLSKRMELPLTLSRFADWRGPETSVETMLRDGVAVEFISDERVGGYLLLRDIAGAPAFVLEAAFDRPIHQYGRRTVIYFTLAFITAAGVLAFMMLRLLDHDVLRRLLHLNDEVGAVAITADLSARVKDEGKDEIAALSRRINDMLAAVQTAHHELRQEKEKAENAAMMRDRLLTLFSHDLKGPLTVMVGYMKLLEEECARAEDEEKRGWAIAAVAAGEMLTALMDEMVSLGQLSSGSLVVRPRRFDAHAAARSVLGQVNAVAAHKQIALENRLPLAVHLFADEMLFQSVLRNIVMNALKFTPNGGSVTLSISENDFAAVSVSDTGIGIAPERIGQLFNFSQNKSTHGTAGEVGSGVGLPLSHEIMKMHGGHLRVESQPGKGTTISMVFPSGAAAGVPGR